MVYSPATRLLSALDLLQSRPSVSAAQLAARLEVNTRSVRRYVTMLQDMGIPVEAVRGRYGGYRLRPGFKLPPLMLTEDEALAVTLGLLATQRLQLGGDPTSVEGALAKVERVLPLGLRERLRAVRATVALDLTAPEQSDAVGRHLLALSAAAHQGRRVSMRYRSPRAGGAEETERMLEPYGVVYHEARWYVVGHCLLRGEVRVFRLDRVLSIAPCSVTFTRPANFDGLEFTVRRFAAMPDRWLVEVALETTLEQVSRSVPASFATLEEIEEVPGGVLLRAYDSHLDHTARFLVGLGCPFTVRQPPELLAALEALAARITRTVAQHEPSCWAEHA